MHQGAVGFINLVVSKRDGEIEFNPHVDGSCLLTLDEDEACALRRVDGMAQNELVNAVSRRSQHSRRCVHCLQRQDRPVIRSTRWVVSPLDFCVHLLLPEGGQVPGVLTARCGHQLPTGVNQHNQPPPGPPCGRCRLIFLADFDTRDISDPQSAR